MIVTPPEPHLPLSQMLADLLAHPQGDGRLTINQLLARTQERGVYLVMIVLCLPFVVPFSIPGLSPILGSIVAILGIFVALRVKPRLPRFVGDRPLPPGLQTKLVGGGVRFLKFIERWIKPRGTQWMSWRMVHSVNALLITLMALLLALPLPAPPFFFTNTVPSYAIIALAASMMEEDGVLIWFAYALVLGNIIFFGLLAGLIVEVFKKTWMEMGQHYFNR